MAFRYHYASRLNSFRNGDWGGKKPTTLDLITRAAKVKGLTAVDLNYPDHLQNHKPAEIAACLKDNGIALNGFAMRYYTEVGFKLGAFTHPDAKVRRAAIDLTKKGIDEMRGLGGNLMTLWMGNDGFDYSFQADYAAQWQHTIEAMVEVADHDKAVDISIEYKPNEPRSYALMPDAATTLLAIKDIARPNLGVTLDFAHVLYAEEMPAFAAMLIARHSRLLGIHLNDGYGKRDDGLMVGSVHPLQTLELLLALRKMDYSAAIYFDTFPDITNLDPVAECAANIATVEALAAIAEKLEKHNGLAEATAKQDAVAAQGIITQMLYAAR
ncbi:sugar phosphate isomerase/epimerase family protein [Aestuariivirga litoralis]|uniref:sugar phosphate isomerase/epimerase family protein n=1 Tax=Aestuariivirga litoralis TaxID=2650924 RepID=UPI0018C6DC46|nr:TIM barrel protein [Aestuariivirga litoralis]MBG1233407.1 sugar phosphate isomerase/epimerase [Aestuariivirga litoralis]